MKLNFKPVKAADIEKIIPFFDLRPNRTCDSQPLDCLIWKDFYHVQYAISEEKALMWLMSFEGDYHSAMPMCREEDLPRYFGQMLEYFNEVLGEPLNIYLADEEAVKVLNLNPSEFSVTEQEDLKDYLYSGDAMRTLSGKKLHKKKNHFNQFLKTYEGRYEYRLLCCSDRQDVWDFLNRWREQKGEDVDMHLDYEVAGIHEILKNCSYIPAKMGGVYLDGNLEAFTIGSLNKRENMAIIHIEKANSSIPGLYQFINQQFLVHEFPEVELVNREDDLGLEGLRKAKMSYYPVDFARKYLVKQINYQN